MASARVLAGIRESFGERHADRRADGGSGAYEESDVRATACEGGGEKGSECRDGAIYQTDQGGLDDLEEERPVNVLDVEGLLYLLDLVHTCIVPG